MGGVAGWLAGWLADMGGCLPASMGHTDVATEQMSISASLKFACMAEIHSHLQTPSTSCCTCSTAPARRQASRAAALTMPCCQATVERVSRCCWFVVGVCVAACRRRRQAVEAPGCFRAGEQLLLSYIDLWSCGPCTANPALAAPSRDSSTVSRACAGSPHLSLRPPPCRRCVGPGAT